MTTLANLLASVLLLWPLLAQGATYTVPSGSANNSSCSNIGTILYAVNNCARNPGDIIDIRAGSYPEQLHGGINANWASGSSWSNPITIRGHAGERVVINPSASGDFFDIIYVAPGQASFLSFENLEVTGENLQMHQGGNIMRFEQDARVIGCLLRNHLPLDPYNGQPFPPHSNGVLAGPNVTVHNTEIHHTLYGIYLSKDNSMVENSYIHDTGGYGIHSFDGGNDPSTGQPWVCAHAPNIIRNNTIARPGLNGPTPQTGGGMVVGQTNGSQIYNNIFLDAACAGCTGITVYNRTCNTQVFNNTIVGNPICLITGDTAQNTDIRNNICFGNGQDIQNNGSGSTINANNPNSRNPRFVDPPNGNYRLQTTTPRSDALDAAANLSSVFTGDITSPTTGLVRPATGNWDQGAYEMEVSGGGGPTSPPSKGTFFLAPGGTTTTDCDAAKGAVGSPSAAPFGTYATARVCMLAGSTLYLRAGTYPPLDSGSTPFSGGSPADGPTTLAAYPGETVTLQATGGSPVVFLHNSTTDHFLIFQGLILDGLNIVGTNGFAAYPGVNDIRLDGVEIRNTYYEGVFLSQTSNVELRNATKVHNSAFASVGVVGLDRTTNTTITGSEVYASGGPGISSYGGNSNLIIEKSTIRNTPSGKGIILGNASTPDSGVRIANDLIYGNTYGIHLQNGVTGAGLYYNTIWSNSVACMLFDSGVTVSEAINNICWQVATITNNAGPTNMVLTTNQTTDPLFASTTPGDANFLHLCGAVGVPVAGCTGKSPAIDTGTPIPSLTSDYASKARPDGVQVDRGALEEVPVSVPPTQVGLVPVYRTTHFLTLLP